MTPRRVVLTLAETQGLTVLEQARACVLAGVKPGDAGKLMRRYATGEAEPDELLAGAMLFYAIGYELELRRDAGASWDDWQSVDLKLDVSSSSDPMLDAEADARVRTSLATGLPPAVAGELTMADVAAYNRAAAEREKGSGRRRRVARVRR